MNLSFLNRRRHLCTTRILWTAGVALSVFMIFHGVTATAAAPNPFYGAPYYDNDEYYWDGYSQTVAEAVQKDWNSYQQEWHVEPYGERVCSYTFTPSSTGPSTGVFGFIQWTGDCGGGDSIFGTRQCPPGWTLTGNSCTAKTELAINATPPFISALSGVVNGHVLTLSLLDLVVTQGGAPDAGVSVALQSSRGSEDQISVGGTTDSSGHSSGSVSTRDQPGTSTITSASPNIETIQPGIIQWLPAEYDAPFDTSCYVVALESNYLSSPSVAAPGLPGKYPDEFLHQTKFQGTGETLDGTFIQYHKKTGRYQSASCPKTKTGNCAVDGVTAAVDPSVIPEGSSIQVDGAGTWTAQDTGGWIKGYAIDLFYGTRLHDCLHQWGRRHPNVELLGYGN